LAVEKLSWEIQQLRKKISYSTPLWTSISAIRSKYFSAKERGYRRYTPRGTLWFHLFDHREDKRKWDEKPASSIEA